MEHSNNPQGGEDHNPHPRDEGQRQDAERSDLAREVDAAIQAAQLQQRAIDALTAKRIAADIQPGSGALYDLATTGKISDDIYAELEIAREVLPETAYTWLAALEDYCLGWSERGQVAGWADLENPSTTDEQRIYHGITEALLEQRSIDHGTARVIASQLHGGQGSALYALASSGAVVDGIREELDRWRAEDTRVGIEPWLDAFAEYIDHREDPGPVEGWHQLWAPQPERGDEDTEEAETERPPYGAAPAVDRNHKGS